MDESKINYLIEIHSDLGHIPHGIDKGANTACNELELKGSEHRSLIKFASNEIGEHKIISKKLDKQAISTHVPSVTPLSMVGRLASFGAYITQIELNINSEVFHFQGISVSKRDSVSMAFIIAMSCIRKMAASVE